MRWKRSSFHYHLFTVALKLYVSYGSVSTVLHGFTYIGCTHSDMHLELIVCVFEVVLPL